MNSVQKIRELYNKTKNRMIWSNFNVTLPIQTLASLNSDSRDPAALREDYNLFKHLIEQAIDDSSIRVKANDLIVDFSDKTCKAVMDINSENDFFNVNDASNYASFKLKFSKMLCCERITFKRKSNHFNIDNNSVKGSYYLPVSYKKLKELKYLLKKHKKINKQHMLLVDKKMAAVLYYIHGFNIKSIRSVIPLTFNQTKQALSFFKDKLELETLQDGRMIVRKKNQKPTELIVSLIKSYLEVCDCIKPDDIVEYLVSMNINCEISKHYVIKILKTRFKAKFLRVERINKAKNTTENKTQRKGVARMLLDCYKQDRIIISLDETSFSSNANKVYSWIIRNNAKDHRPLSGSIHKNITLLLAVSQNRIEGYYIFEGFLNQIIFVDFLYQLVNELQIRYPTKYEDIHYIMDNLPCHKTLLVKSVIARLNMKIIYNCPYSPELNHVENLFSRLKRNMSNKQPTNST